MKIHISAILILFATTACYGVALGGSKPESLVLPESADALIPRFRHTIATLPEQVHLSLGDDSFSMVVLWSTAEEYDEGPSYVHYGLGEDNFTLSAKAKAEDLSIGNYLGCRGVFQAVMVNLIPHRIHSYKVETGGHFSRKFTFLHRSNRTDSSGSFLVYGDLGKIGGGYTVDRLTEEANSGGYDAVLHVGDFAYNFHDEGGQRGDDFMNRIEPIATKLPYMHCPGNHEIIYDFVHYRYRFSSPGVSWPIPIYQMWYSFDIGMVHFISYSTEVYFTYDSQYVSSQFAWLAEDLEKANRNREQRPWIVAFGHRPMYCSNFDADDCTKNISSLRKEPYNLERLFHSQGVDLIIQAHEHSYERLHPLYNDTQTDCGYTNPKAPVHIISGSAGCNERHLLCADVILGKQHSWSAKRSWLPGLNGYARLHAINSTHLQWVQIMAISDQPMDEFTIIQQHHGPRNNTDPVEEKCGS